MHFNNGSFDELKENEVNYLLILNTFASVHCLETRTGDEFKEIKRNSKIKYPQVN